MNISIDSSRLSNKVRQYLQKVENPEDVIIEAIEVYIDRIPFLDQQQVLQDTLLRIEHKIDGLYSEKDGERISQEKQPPIVPQQNVPSERQQIATDKKKFDPQQAVDDLAKALDFFS